MSDSTRSEDEVEPDREQIKVFLDVVFGYCDGLIPVRNLREKGQEPLGPASYCWLEIGSRGYDTLADIAATAARTRTALYVIPGTVAEHGQASAHHVLQMQSLVVDIDGGDIATKLAHLIRFLGPPTLIVESGGLTEEGADKLHAWWRLTEAVSGRDLAHVCDLRRLIAEKVGADGAFASAHQPIRVAGSVYHKYGARRLVRIREHNEYEFELKELAEAVADMPQLPGLQEPPKQRPTKPAVDDVLVTPVREGDVDAFSRFEGASVAIGHFVRLVHEGRFTWEDGWEAICGYNAAMLRPPWPLDRLRSETDRLWRRHLLRYGPEAKRQAPPPAVPVYALGQLLDDPSPPPPDLISPRVLTPGGLLVLGGAPKVGKSDFLINLLVHTAAGIPFLRFEPPRPMRVFYLQAEIGYPYLKERLHQMRLDRALIAEARERLVVTPKLRLILNEGGVAAVADAIQRAFPDEPPDIICIDPLRNLFDGGPGDKTENDNDAMMFFLQNRIEALREAVAPHAGVIVAHHTRKLFKKQFAEDPFQAFAGASALRGFYTTGIVMFRPDEAGSQRELHIELRNGAGLDRMTIDKIDGEWVEIDESGQRLVRKDIGSRLDAERMRRHEVILRLIYDEALNGRFYTMAQFAQAFENQDDLGSSTSIRERIGVLATKGYIRFVASVPELALQSTRSKFGFLCVEGMKAPVERPDAETGEVSTAVIEIVPTHFKCPQTGAVRPVATFDAWHYVDDEWA
jgi:hypothetical protein